MCLMSYCTAAKRLWGGEGGGFEEVGAVVGGGRGGVREVMGELELLLW